MRKRLALLALLISNIAIGYPQTIVKKYQNCKTCHLSNDGGDILSDYGRAMSEAFMATFAAEGEAREFMGLAESPAIDLQLDYRTMRLADVETGKSTAFPMYTVAGLALRHAGLTLFATFGSYGRERRNETRHYGVNYNVTHNAHSLDFKFGYWLPMVGIGLNNHDLSIKKAQGFGRGQEKFVVQASWLNPWFEVKAMRAQSQIRIEKNEKNWPEDTSGEKPEHIFEAKLKRIEGFELGGHMRRSAAGISLTGYSLRIGRGSAYMLMQGDRNDLKGIETTYARSGFFPFRGLDLYFEFDRLVTLGALSHESKGLGVSWMIRPRFELEASAVQSLRSKTYVTSTKLWL